MATKARPPLMMLYIIFSEERSPQKQLPATTAFETPAGNNAGSPEGSDARKDNAI